MTTSTIVVAGALLLGLLLWIAFDLCRTRLRKQENLGMRKALRILAATSMAYLMLLFGLLAFFLGHTRGTSGQALAGALTDIFVPFRTPEIVLLPTAICWFLLLLALAVGLVLVLTARKSGSDPKADTPGPPEQ